MAAPGGSGVGEREAARQRIERLEEELRALQATARDTVAGATTQGTSNRLRQSLLRDQIAAIQQEDLRARAQALDAQPPRRPTRASPPLRANRGAAATDGTVGWIPRRALE